MTEAMMQYEFIKQRLLTQFQWFKIQHNIVSVLTIFIADKSPLRVQLDVRAAF